MPTVLAPAPPAVRYTEQEYLLRERDALEKSDFLNGEIIPMPGTSLSHVRISTNLIRFLAPRLEEQGCECYANDLRTKVFTPEKVLYTYPDFIVVCGKPQLAADEFDNLINPRAIVEILSSGTENYDMGVKAMLYRTVPSLSELIFVSQLTPFVQHYQRQADDKWLLTTYHNLTAEFFLANVPLKLVEIYHLVEFKL